MYPLSFHGCKWRGRNSTFSCASPERSGSETRPEQSVRSSVFSVFSSPSRSGSEVRLEQVQRSAVSVPSSICVSSQAA